MKTKLLSGIQISRFLSPLSEDYLSFETVDLKTERDQTLSLTPAMKDKKLWSKKYFFLLSITLDCWRTELTCFGRASFLSIISRQSVITANCVLFSTLLAAISENLCECKIRIYHYVMHNTLKISNTTFKNKIFEPAKRPPVFLGDQALQDINPCLVCTTFGENPTNIAMFHWPDFTIRHF